MAADAEPVVGAAPDDETVDAASEPVVDNAHDDIEAAVVDPADDVAAAEWNPQLPWW